MIFLTVFISAIVSIWIFYCLCYGYIEKTVKREIEQHKNEINDNLKREAAWYIKQEIARQKSFLKSDN